jgi:LysM repeat protein
MTRRPEHYLLSIALVVPLFIAALTANQLAGIGLAAPAHSEAASAVALVKRPIGSQVTVPPTLTVPTPTPVPTAAPTPVVEPTPRAATYTVQPGDELKHIAADFGVNIFKIISANDIPDPDSLRVGQVLRIPEN